MTIKLLPQKGLYQAWLLKLLLYMKLTFTLVLLLTLQVTAKLHSQEKISLNVKNERIDKVLKLIERQSKYHFVYSTNYLNTEKRLDLNVNNADLREVLNKLFNGEIKYSSTPSGMVMLSLSEENLSDITVKGKVTDKSGALPGASVYLKSNPGIGTTTDGAGNFVINVPDDGVLVIKSIGYKMRELPVNKQTVINVVMEEEDNNLTDVVVVGYGTQKKASLTSAINTVDKKLLTSRPVSSLTTALQGVVPGMAIKATPGDVGNDLGTINIRGRGNLGGSDALYVVDGVIVSAADFARINPNDVENLSILKDASATAIYGARAGYGVILVTTKKGNNGKATINYNGYYGIQSPTVLPKWLGSYDYATLRNEAAANAGQAAVYSVSDMQKIQDHSDPDHFPDNDWYKLTLRETAPMMEHNLNVSGGNDATKYYIGGTYFKQNSLQKGKDLGRFSLRSNIDTKVTDKFKVGTNLSFTRDNIDNPNGPLSFLDLNRLVPLMVNKQSNGNWGTINGNRVDGTLGAINTIRKMQEGGRNVNTQNRFLGTVNATYSPIKGLDITGLVSYNYVNIFTNDFLNTIDPLVNFNTGANISGTGVATNQLTQRWQTNARILTQGLVSYEKNIDKHYFKILGGTSYENYTTRFVNVIRKNFVNNSLNDIDGGSTDPLNTATTGRTGQNAFESGFGRLNYAYDNKYLLEASVRFDGSSQFAPGHRWGNYPAVSGAWRISQEDFMKNVNWVNDLKIRASWGKSGNVNNVGNYDFYDALKTGSTVILDESQQDGVYPAQLFNPLLSWEKITTTNFGLDATLFKGLNIQLDVFNRLTQDILLQDPRVPIEAGLVYDPGDLNNNEYPSVNLGKVRNKGVELTLGYSGSVRDFKYSIGGNISKTKNTIEDLGGAQSTPVTGYYQNQVGNSVGAFYMYQSDGLFSTNAEVASHAFQSNATKAGDIKYVDQNGDGKIDADDRKIVGNDVPYLIYGLNFSASYKNFDISVLGQGVNNVKVYLEQEASQAFFNSAGAKSYVLNRWTAANPDPNAVYPRVLTSANNTQNLVLSDFWLFNADYFRIKNITLGYNLPDAWLKKIGFKALRIYASSNNPFTIRGDKRLKDFDPETPSARSSYPQLKTYSFGLNLSL
ncbi:SusC/RagA family TonB-linked outer membrane protein [Pedobacter punctiformis]|uniref:TonB-dependent receptor n=1 Tax=Pedobacter punctiformis TaxID=3004097 RepID=A0ABT4L3V3_9SPHI|nr:TonB-dependent receptor [Pedobacter sp. HCMS5-2]MCZ4242596.1 TonB-dependent receptor [Pedobacter sp. HCMS5-2]